ncbi:DUF262 domain-containing protein [Acidaminococcus sp. NSJ-142]|jgi:hypothetical protein|uniref:DUF262 domain-containing protein n=1 Tax=Acidaminococcus hominis TaxID=2897706 RepID=UPI001E4F2AD2|nr:DUF262 domain-containing protein [Acidaminococcus hominis]MCD2435426.1 DUF262 domain-containing protein [Acidaminococcus hominis]
MAYETPLTIAEVMQDISNNKYVLPSIQREYVWDTEQIETLFDSLMQDYPIGAFLFWEIEKSRLLDYDFYEFLRNYHEKNNTHNKKVDLKGSDGVTAVLDGQQRLTSLYIGLKGSYAYRLKYKQKKSENAYPVRYLYLNLIEDAQDETNKYDFRFLTDKEFSGMPAGFWYKVGDIITMTQPGETSQYVLDNIAFAGTYTKEQTMHANNTLQKLYNVVHTDKTLSYYKEKVAELDKVLNIFIRVNSGGTVLTYSDLLLSIASAQWENHDAREEITEFVDDVNSIGGGFRINKDFVLKTALVLTDFPNIAFKVDNFNKPNMMKIETNWENIKRAIKLSVHLVSSFGYTGDTLSSNNALIPIAYYLLTIGMPDSFVESGTTKENRAKIKKWLIMTLLKKAFSGQPDNVIRPIRDIIRENGNNEFPIAQIIDKFKGSNKSIQFAEDDIDEYLLKLKYGKNETLSTLMLLYPSLDFSNKFHEDHMYPKSKFRKSYLRKMGVPEDKLDTYIDSVNDISNLQLLAAQLNEEKLNTDFGVWFNKQQVTDSDKIQYRMIHYLPEMEYTYPNFLLFIDKRKQMLRKKLIEILL